MNWNHPHILARRERTAWVIVIGAFVLLAGAFFRLQVLGSDQYAVQSRQNRLRPLVLPGSTKPSKPCELRCPSGIRLRERSFDTAMLTTGLS